MGSSSVGGRQEALNRLYKQVHMMKMDNRLGFRISTDSNVKLMTMYVTRRVS